MTEQSRPEHPLGIAEGDFNQWKHHPVTKVFRKFLEDYVGSLERAHVARWRQGRPDEQLEAWASGQTAGIAEIAELEFEDIEAFYTPPEQPEEDDGDQHIHDGA